MSDKPMTEEEFNRQMNDDYDKNLKTELTLQENKEMMAKVQHQKLKMQLSEMNRISNMKSIVDGEDITKRTFDRESMVQDLKDRENAILFLNKKISEHIIIAPGSLIAIASMTSNGKSTLTAHIAEAIIKQENKPVLILSNEETEEDSRARVSCLRMNVSFGDYKSNKCTPEQIEMVLDDAELLANTQKLIVISSKTEADAYRVNTVEGVVTTMKAVDGKAGAVILDYYQNVNTSELGQVEPWHVNNKLATELNVLKGTLQYPIIAMAQCKGITSDKKITDKGALDFDNNHPMYRWKGGANLLTYATDILELVKDFNNSCSFLFAHKTRFSHGDLQRLHMLPFDKRMQKFIEWSAEHDVGVTVSKVTKETRDRVEELGFGDVFKKDK